MSNRTITVCITGAAGRIAYSLIPSILNGLVFGSNVEIDLRLLDIPMAMDKLRGVVMELEDSGFHLLKRVIATTNTDEAFSGVEVAILLGGMPRLPGMERRDLLVKNAESIQLQAIAMNKYGNENTKVIVVANPANTNCLVAIKNAPNIPAKNFTCLTRLDEERLRGFCRHQVQHSQQLIDPISAQNIKNVFILGNHSTTQVAHIDNGVAMVNNQEVKITDCYSEEEYQTMLKRVQNRGAEIIKVLQVSSASSAAEAIVKHLRDWLGNNNSNNLFSMGILSNGNPYNIPDDLVYSFPCERKGDGDYSIHEDLTLSPKIVELMRISAKELLEEREAVLEYL